MIGLLTAAVLAAEPVALDAGSAGSPVMTGFAQLHAEGSTDPRATWMRPPERAFREGEPDPLVEDGLAGGVLHLDLDPGQWRVWVQVGERWHYAPPSGRVGVVFDGATFVGEVVPEGPAVLASRFYAASPFPEFVAGQTEWDRVVAPGHPWLTGTVEVGGSGVELETVGQPLQALVMVPEARVTEGELIVEVADRLRREWFTDHADRGSKDWVPPDPGAGTPRAQVTSWFDNPDPDLATSSPRVEAAVAPGEWLGRAIWLFPGDEGWSWTLDGLDGLEDVRVWEIHWHDHRRHAWRRPRPTFLRPTDGAIRGGQGVPVGVAITGRVSDRARRRITGALRLTRGSETIAVDVDLRVRTMNLDSGPPAGFFFDRRAAALSMFGVDDPRTKAIVDEDLGLMRHLGFDAVGLRFADPWDGTVIGSAWVTQPTADVRIFEDLARSWRESGGGPIVWMDAYFLLNGQYRRKGVPLLTRRHAPVLPQLARATLAVGGETYLYLYDENASKHDLSAPDRAAEVISDLRAAVPGIRIAAAAPMPVDWGMAQHADLVFLHWQTTHSAANVDLARVGNTRAWMYNFSKGRGGPGLFAWAVGADGTMAWHWNAAKGDPFDDLHLTWQHQFALLGPDGHVYPQLEALEFAEARVDARYLTTVERLVGELGDRRRPRIRAAVDRGRDVLTAARGAADGSWVRIGEDAAWPAEALDLLRGELGDLAETLGRFSRKKR